MRAPSGTRARRYPVVDEIDSPNILPPLDRPFDSILTSRTRLRTTTYLEDPLARRLLGHHHGPVTTLQSQSRRTSRPVRETKDPHGLRLPSPIRVEMLSCDGGSLDFDDSGRYNAENLLIDNISVYCTAKLENVNILLRGAGARPFTLSRIEIKAPQRSFTSPVKDGLVFISMERIQASETRRFDREPSSSQQSCSDSEDEEDSNTSNLTRLLAGLPLSRTTTDIQGTSVNGGIIPHAYFVVDSSSGHATVTFDPPVSGRYVHVKLLSGQPFDAYPGHFERDNIDIQAILLYGFGRRVFPTSQYR